MPPSAPRRGPRRIFHGGLAALAAVLTYLAAAAPARAEKLVTGFAQGVVISGLRSPVNLEFAPDGRLFVAEKNGRILVFEGVGDPQPDVLADLGPAVHDFWDRGLLGLAVDPQFPARPYVYVMYTHNFDPLDPGAGFPRWPDSCPDPPGATGDGCVVNGRISRLEVGPDNRLVGSEAVLVEGRWCQQYPSHSTGDLTFLSDGTLVASAGDGANFNAVDYGQWGGSRTGTPTPRNPCGDPPGGRGGPMSPPSAQGGALRSQDLRAGGDAVSLDGTLIRIHPDTGLAPPDNPLIGGDPGDDPIVALGLRNPFRITTRPGTREVWAGDVGWSTWEEINRVADPVAPPVENLGWPCYEGAPRQGAYDSVNLDLCEQLYAETTNPAQAPFYAYDHALGIDADADGVTCANTGSSSIAGVQFYTTGPFPARYDNALFFADYSRRCIFALRAGAGGLPDPATRHTFVDGAFGPVDLEVGPDGWLYYADLDGGRVVRVTYTSANRPPVAAAAGSPTSGLLPLAVSFDASASSDPDPDATLSFAWDLDADGTFDDGTGALATYTYLAQGVYAAAVRVTDEEGDASVAVVPVTAGNRAPVVTIDEPAEGTLWRVGDSITFSGRATDPDDGPLDASRLHWTVTLFHCPGGHHDCHEHHVEEFDGVASGTTTAPDHEYYSYLEFALRATDHGFPDRSGGLLSASAARPIDPRTVDLTFTSEPAGLALSVGSTPQAAPFTRRVIVGSTNSVSAPSPQDMGGDQFEYVTWDHTPERSHAIVAGEFPQSFHATYRYDGVAASWWDRAWRSRLTLTLDGSALAADLVDFPVLVRLDPARIDYGRTRDQGQDVRLTDSAGALLAHEIERWDEAGASAVWVKVPLIAAGRPDTRLHLYFDNPVAADGQNRAAVWSNGYVGVWHLDPTLTDATSYGHHGSNVGSLDVAGRIGRAREFSGSAYVNAGNGAALGVTGQMTITALARHDDPNANAYPRIVSKKPAWDAPEGYNLELNPGQNFVTNLTSGGNYGRATGVDLDAGWHHFAAVVEGGRSLIYVDGTQRNQDETCDPLIAGATALNIGRETGGGNHWDGAIDELRLASVARSPAWVLWESRAANDELLVYGAAEDNCGALDALCNGWDEDCDGSVDEDVAVPDLVGRVRLDGSRIRWDGVARATHYDVVRGTLPALTASGGDFASSLDACVADDTPLQEVQDAHEPDAGFAAYYLVRAGSCGRQGSYDEGDPGLAGSRDPGIAAAPGSCP